MKIRILRSKILKYAKFRFREVINIGKSHTFLDFLNYFINIPLLVFKCALIFKSTEFRT